MSKTSSALKFDLFDAVGAGIEEGMKFKVARKEKIDAGDGIVMEGLRLTKGMQFKLCNDFKLGKKQIISDDLISISGDKNFRFQEDDIIVIDSVESSAGGDTAKVVSFHIERESKTVENNGETVTFKMESEKFSEVFDDHTDIEIEYLHSFKFKPKDVIVVSSVSELPKSSDTDNYRGQIVFRVMRDGSVVIDDTGDEMVFTFNSSIFAQRFEKFTDVIDQISQVSSKVRKLVEDFSQEK